MEIPLCRPYITDDEISLVREVLESGWLAHGPKNKSFEQEFASFIGTKRAVSLNSATSALQLAIQALNLKGDVIVPSFTFVASANSIVTAGCKPVFVDIDYDTCNIDVSKIEEKITPQTKAIMPVHYAGQSCKMAEIMELANKYDLKVIEDSAECIGGTYQNKKTGSFGVGCFSFFPTKNMTSGEGGMLTTNDEMFAERVQALRGHGILSSTFEREKIEKPWLRAATYAGYNYRLCDVLAAIGLAQLRKLSQMNELRRSHANYLNKNLIFDDVDLPLESEGCQHVYQMYTIKLSERIDRTKFILELRRKSIGANVHFDPPVHQHPYYAKEGYNLPVTEKVASSIVTLPMYPQLKREELDYVISSVGEVLKYARKI